jgi:hypothetical protein
LLDEEKCDWKLTFVQMKQTNLNNPRHTFAFILCFRPNLFTNLYIIQKHIQHNVPRRKILNQNKEITKMNFMSKSKSYLLYEDTKSIKKRISFGFSNRSAVLDNSISLETNTGCVLQKVNSHECLDALNYNDSIAMNSINENLVNQLFKTN